MRSVLTLSLNRARPWIGEGPVTVCALVAFARFSLLRPQVSALDCWLSSACTDDEPKTALHTQRKPSGWKLNKSLGPFSKVDVLGDVVLQILAASLGIVLEIATLVVLQAYQVEPPITQAGLLLVGEFLAESNVKRGGVNGVALSFDGIELGHEDARRKAMRSTEVLQLALGFAKQHEQLFPSHDGIGR